MKNYIKRATVNTRSYIYTNNPPANPYCELKLLCYANIRNICIAISSRNLSVIAFCVCAWRTYSELRKGGLE